MQALLKLEKLASCDTETTGLMWQQGDSLFSIVLVDSKQRIYVNFKTYEDERVKGLSMKKLKPALEALFLDPTRAWFFQNAKFDLHMLAAEGFRVKGKIYDTKVLDRIHFNQHMSYSLDAITSRWGERKLDEVKEYITKNKLKTSEYFEEFDKDLEKLHYDRVPYWLISKYAIQDGVGTLHAGNKIFEAIRSSDLEVTSNIPRQLQVVEMESQFLKCLFKMEQVGVQLDVGYCKEALEYYRGRVNSAKERFEDLTGVEFVKGTTVFENVFYSEKDKWEKTLKGNWRWDAAILRNFENPAGKIAVEYAEAKKQFEYFANFLYFADGDGVLHPSFDQAGTVTGRLSCRDPNLQNLTNPDKYEGEKDASKYPVRRSFIPRPGYFFLMPDYSQVEFRMLLDLARSNELINEVLKGLDVHTATANVSGASRKEAKTVNFLTAYGGGVVKLAQNLYEPRGTKDQLGAIYKDMFGWRKSEGEQEASKTVTKELRDYNEPIIRKAYDVQQSIFRSAPEIKDLLKRVQSVAKSRGYIRNWLGRRYYYPDKRWAYKAPNHLIQGGAAEVIKLAMLKVDAILEDHDSRMLLSIHDEIILEMKYGEEHLVPLIKEAMETVYPHWRLPLLVDVEFSKKNLADKEAWVFNDSMDEARGDEIQGESSPTS